MNESARSIFQRFRAMSGSEQVATEFAIDGIMAWARRSRGYGIAVDYGSGLGTIANAIRVANPLIAAVVCFERDRSLWRLGVDPRCIFVDTLADWMCLAKAPFKLVVIDDRVDTYDLGTLAMRGLSPRAAVLFEGNRPCERGALTAMLAHVGRAHCHAEWKPPDRSKGYHVVLCDPTLTERAWFAAVRLREGLLDRIARWRGVAPGWRKRDHDRMA